MHDRRPSVIARPGRPTRRAALAGLGAALLPARGALAQGFAGMGAPAEGFSQVTPGPALTFPADHGPHPGHRIEWWYVTANLSDDRGTPRGLQWTLFRSALAPETGAGWQDPQIWFAHAAVTTPDRHLTAERRARGGVGVAGVRAAPFRARIADWAMTADGAGIGRLTLSAAGGAFAYDLTLTADAPPVAHGKAGYSEKSPGGPASYYYAQPFYSADGHVDLPDRRAPVTGRAWLDREWSSTPLTPDQGGWDWTGLHLEGGAKLMIFRLRGDEVVTAGSWIDAGGAVTALAFDAATMTPERTARVAGRSLPVAWRIRLPARGLDVTLEAINDAAWMDVAPPYWEGPVTVRGSHAGEGYLEMTGY